jgi:cytochrome c553
MMKTLSKISLILCFLMPILSRAESAANWDRQWCSTCHGIGGITTSEQFPALAGQPAPYISKQLKAYKDKTRSNLNAERFMWGMAARLSDEEIEAIAVYYEAQSPNHHGKVTDKIKYDSGMNIYVQGNADKGIPACALCHGDKAQGVGEMPRLAGQHEEYLKKQLKVFYGNQRPAAVAMHEIVKGLTDADIEALAQYLQAQ